MKLTRVLRAAAVLGIVLAGAAALQGCAIYPVPVAPQADVHVDIGAGYYRPYYRPYYPYYGPRWHPPHRHWRRR